MLATSTSTALATAALTQACTCGRLALGSAAEVRSTSRRSSTAARASANASRAWRLLARLCSVAASAFARSKARSRGSCWQRGATDLPKMESVRSNGAPGRPPVGDVERVGASLGAAAGGAVTTVSVGAGRRGGAQPESRCISLDLPRFPLRAAAWTRRLQVPIVARMSSRQPRGPLKRTRRSRTEPKVQAHCHHASAKPR